LKHRGRGKKTLFSDRTVGPARAEVRVPRVQRSRFNAFAKIGEEYNRAVARGWESKSVEAQQADAGDKAASSGPRMSAAEAARWREKENLRLSRQRVLQQMEASRNPRHRQLLQDALADLDEKLRGLEK
jgi:hypothetical protein